MLELNGSVGSNTSRRGHSTSPAAESTEPKTAVRFIRLELNARKSCTVAHSKPVDAAASGGLSECPERDRRRTVQHAPDSMVNIKYKI